MNPILLWILVGWFAVSAIIGAAAATQKSSKDAGTSALNVFIIALLIWGR